MDITASFRLMQARLFLSICSSQEWNKNWTWDVRNLIFTLPSGPGDWLRQCGIPRWVLVNGAGNCGQKGRTSDPFQRSRHVCTLTVKSAGSLMLSNRTRKPVYLAGCGDIKTMIKDLKNLAFISIIF